MSTFVVFEWAHPSHQTWPSEPSLRELDAIFEEARHHLVPRHAHLEPWRERLSDATGDPDRHLWVAFQAGPAPKMLGAVDTQHHHPQPGVVTVRQVAVHRGHRHRGIAKALLECAMNPLPTALAHVRTESARGFWRHLGFRELEHGVFSADQGAWGPDRAHRLARTYVRAATEHELPGCLEVRTQVFVQEQGVEPSLELDGLDEACTHFAAIEAGRTIATARLRPHSPIEAKAERVAVIEPERGRGLGQGLMAALEMEALCRGFVHLSLHAQLGALRFYQNLGYDGDGPVFFEAGLPHRSLSKRLALNPQTPAFKG